MHGQRENLCWLPTRWQGVSEEWKMNTPRAWWGVRVGFPSEMFRLGDSLIFFSKQNLWLNKKKDDCNAANVKPKWWTDKLIVIMETWRWPFRRCSTFTKLQLRQKNTICQRCWMWTMLQNHMKRTRPGNISSSSIRKEALLKSYGILHRRIGNI